MSVTVDREFLAVEQLGLRTVGQVLAHLKRDNRLVVHLLVDGQEPHLDQLNALRRTPLSGHTLYIETADPRRLAIETLEEVSRQLPEAQRLKTEAADLLQQNRSPKALEQLGGCIRIWQCAQESIGKTAELLRIDADSLRVRGRTLGQILAEFSVQLKQIRAALEQRDFVTLSDCLTYETTDTTANWLDSIAALRELIESQ